MTGRLSSLNRQVDRIEQRLIDTSRRVDLAKCICARITVADPEKLDKFEAQMNQTCPVHGFRRLGMIFQVRPIGREGDREKNDKLDHLVQTYKARQSSKKIRLSQLKRFARELMNGHEEN
jgi:hypothetical protein